MSDKQLHGSCEQKVWTYGGYETSRSEYSNQQGGIYANSESFNAMQPKVSGDTMAQFGSPVIHGGVEHNTSGYGDRQEKFLNGGGTFPTDDGKPISIQIRGAHLNEPRIRCQLNGQGGVTECTGKVVYDHGKPYYSVDAYVENGRIHKAQPGHCYANIPLYKGDRNGVATY